MKFRVTMKDPDCLNDAIADAVRESLAADERLDADEMDAVGEVRREKVGESCKRWFKWGEYLTVEVDTDAGTCVVTEAT